MRKCGRWWHETPLWQSLHLFLKFPLVLSLRAYKLFLTFMSLWLLSLRGGLGFSAPYSLSTLFLTTKPLPVKYYLNKNSAPAKNSTLQEWSSGSPFESGSPFKSLPTNKLHHHTCCRMKWFDTLVWWPDRAVNDSNQPSKDRSAIAQVTDNCEASVGATHLAGEVQRNKSNRIILFC